MAYSLRLRFNRLPQLQPDQFVNVHKRNRIRKDWHREVWGEVLAHGGKPAEPLTRADVLCVRHSAGPEPDDDNLTYSFKPILDGLVRAGVLADDCPSVTRPEVHWLRAPRNEGHVTVTVTPAPASSGDDAGSSGPAP